jgi:hypothetical protein
MTPPADENATTLWEGGFSDLSAPPALPDLASGGITIVSWQPPNPTGKVVRYSGGRFTEQFWSGPGGPAVPLLIEVLDADKVREIRKEVVEQLHGPRTGLDEIPLKAFVEAATLFLEHTPSHRFADAVLGPIAESAPGELTGQLSWAGGGTGTVQASADGVRAQTHVPAAPDTTPEPLRQADIASLVAMLRDAVGGPGVDGQWEHLLSFAEQALPGAVGAAGS